MLSEVDREGDGCISVEAFMSRVGPACDPACDSEDLKEVFEVFDTDHDGKISAEELLRFFQSIGDERCTLEECRRMIEGVDRNKDGFVCFEDFSRMMELQRWLWCDGVDDDMMIMFIWGCSSWYDLKNATFLLLLISPFFYFCHLYLRLWFGCIIVS